MTEAIQFPDEPLSNRYRLQVAAQETRGQRTFTPTQAVLAKSEGLYHWTPEGRRLADFTSGVLVANLGHNPRSWLKRLAEYMGWTPHLFLGGNGFAPLPGLTTYNAISPLEAQANQRLLDSLRRCRGGERMEKVLWSASGSEGIIKAIWAAMSHSPGRDIILATRHGFHGKKGLAGAVTGDEHAPERDPRVRFLSFPMRECHDLVGPNPPFDAARYRAELDALAAEFPNRLCCLVTEPYLGGGGSYHPPKEYLRLLQDFCREQEIPFILDEVQANFGRTGRMYAFETYGVEPDMVVLGKGMANGVPINAVVGRSDILGALEFGHGSDTWSGHPLGCAAVLATLDEFESRHVIEASQAAGDALARGVRRLRELPLVTAVRGEAFVWGVELRGAGALSSREVANELVRACYLGDEQGHAIHLLGPLAGNVIRVSPPLTSSVDEIDFWMDVLYRILGNLEAFLSRPPESIPDPALDRA